MERLSKIYNENRRACAIGGAFMLSAATAMYFMRRRKLPASVMGIHRWQDPHFKSENLALYSDEAVARAK